MRFIKYKLRKWGERYSGDTQGQGFAPETPIARAMVPGRMLGTPWRPEGLEGEQAALIDMDRAINQLPPNLRVVVIAEYTVPGTYKDRCAMVDMPRSTYYRKLKQAHHVLEAVELLGQVVGSLAVDDIKARMAEVGGSGN